ncbi:MAG: UDP-2,3-diacetamido-2,3-dideoxy-D-glucuronate 2-epimerase [Spirochaetes bacterium ADurb.Bin110]|nr:MAG: UDP-2,3-diacetamido-2,3-dideoxy-D-glucuronate 2-epimerase [Spirochaetes bacterium ADurb.Bin110]
MLDKLKVMTIIGTRPEIIRLSEVIRACDKYFNHILVHTGQNYDYTLNEIFFKDLELRAPDYYLDAVGNDLGETIGNIIAKSYKLLLQEKPDALLVLGDTNSALCAIPAKRLKIPIFHMEAGNRCFDQNVPEEINRKIVDHIADINLPYTEHSRRYLLSEGLRKEHIFVTGSPMAEVIARNKAKIESSKALEKYDVEKKKYFVLSMHREENIDIEYKFKELVKALNSLAETYGLPIVFSTHPRTWKRLELDHIGLDPLIRNVKPLAFTDYCRMQCDAACVISDSGTLSEESSILRFPAVLLRNSTERPEVLDKGTIVIGGYTEESLLQSVDLAINSFDSEDPRPKDYCDTNVSQKVVKIIQSYTSIINQFVWNKF